MSTPTIDEVVKKYIEVRDDIARKKAAYEADIKPQQEALEKIESYLLAKANDQGVESFKTQFGTAYTAKRTSVTIADREIFKQFCEATGDWGLVDIRASKKAVEQYVEANQEVPPGINVVVERTLNVRRS